MIRDLVGNHDLFYPQKLSSKAFFESFIFCNVQIFICHIQEFLHVPYLKLCPLNARLYTVPCSLDSILGRTENHVEDGVAN